jgi:hypothetical protein
VTSGDVLRWGGGIGIAFGALALASVTIEPLAYWDLDPFSIWAPRMAIGPWVTLLLAAVVMVGAGIGLAGEAMCGRRVNPAMAAAWGLGSIGVLLHGWVIGGADLEDIRIGATWSAAIAGGIAMAHLMREPRLARVLGAVLVGFAAMLAVKGAMQVYVEHPATVADYQASREAFLQARGWSPDSAMARAFERRLMQAEATGWFGLSNVYASIVASCGVALAGLAVAGWRASRRESGRISDGWPGLVSLGVAATLGGLLLSNSRGGVVAFVVGIVMLVGGVVIRRRFQSDARRAVVGGWMGVGLIVLVLIGIGARGLIGERLGELSIMFRSFYAEAALRVFASHPLFGVGPAGFKDAYLLAKPALSPEEVASPHIVVLDYVSTLGVLGLAWVGVLVMMSWRAGARLAGSDSHGREMIGSPGRAEGWVVIVVAAAATMLSAMVEAPGATIEGSLGRLVGLAAWCGVGLGVLVVIRSGGAWRACLGAGALALLAHAQIDVPATWVGSSVLFLALVGAGAPERDAPARQRRIGIAIGGLVCTAGVGLIVGAVWPAWAWESRLVGAAEQARDVAFMRTRLGAIDRSGRSASGDSISQIAGDLSRLTGRPVQASGEGVVRGLSALTLDRIERARTELASAIAIYPSHEAVLKTMSRLAMEAGAVTTDAIERGRWLTAAAGDARTLTERQPGSASAWSWRALVLSTIWEQTGQHEAVEEALQALQRAHELDPHSLLIADRLVDLNVALARPEEARRWAEIALGINESLRLDPLKQATEDRVRLLRSYLSGD